MTTSSKISPSLLAQMRANFTGHVIAPGDAEYDQARTVFVGDVDRRPTVVVRPADAAEVAQVVGLARDTGLELAVRSGGHSSAGHGVTDGGIMLDLAALRTLDIDPDGRTAWAATGLTAGEYTQAASAHGLATGFGDAGSVGLGGLTTGGGLGYLSRKHGLTVDDVLAAEVATADGDIVTTDAEHHPDLFWAIRGGGGNFGVVTRFHYRLHDVSSTVGGMLILPATVDTIHEFIAAASAAPNELSVIANVVTAPPAPFIPAEYHGQLVLLAMVCYAGPADDGEQVIAPLRALATPIADMVRPISYPEMYPPENAGHHPTAVGRTFFADALDRDTIPVMLDFLNRSDAPLRVVQFRPLGGAIDTVSAEATAYAHRGRKFMVNVVSFYAGPDDRPARATWVNDLSAVLDTGTNSAYVNFLADDGQERIHEAYPGDTWNRLAAIKHRYDPGNLFRVNHNITPQPAS